MPSVSVGAAVLFVDLKSEDTKNSKAPAVAVVCPLLSLS